MGTGQKPVTGRVRACTHLFFCAPDLEPDRPSPAPCQPLPPGRKDTIFGISELPTKDNPMDYSKSGNTKFGKGTPSFDAQNRKGAPKDKHGKTHDKDALLARLKAAAEAKRKN